jgi:hypothetical protein
MHAIAALDTTLLPSTSCCDDITNRFKNALDNSTLQLHKCQTTFKKVIVGVNEHNTWK